MLSDYAQLSKPAQAKVAQLADKFQQLSAIELRQSKGIHLEGHKGQKDPRARTIRIDDNHRGVVFDAGNDDLFVLTRIGTHQDVDHWMAHNLFKVNEATGAFEIIDTHAIEGAISNATVAVAPDPQLYAHRKDKDFTQLGIDRDLVPVLRVFTSDDQLQGLLGVLPQRQADALIMLTGPEAVEVIYSEIAGDVDPGSIDAEDLMAAIQTPASLAQFAIITSEDELQKMFAQPLAQWRTYLHPSQRDAVNRHFNGPARVTGGAGTGKTVVAIHRAVRLAEQLHERNGHPILFTTFTRNLAQAIESDVRDLGGTDALEVIDVLNVDRLAYRVVQDAERHSPVVIHGQELRSAWRSVVDERAIELEAEFLANEWEQVILAQGCASRDDYLTVSRAGRGVRLDRRQRAEVWKAVEAFNRRLIDSGKRTYLQLSVAAEGYLRERTVKPYQHVVVDEAQDLHEAQWRMLRAAVPEQANDMFLVGDSHQRIYDRRSSLSKVGVNIRGRSRKLRLNYRTTHEILAWALSLLGEGSYDDLDEGIDTHDFAGYHSLVHGPRPTLYGAKSTKEELSGLVAQLQSWVRAGVAEEDIGITTRRSESFEQVQRALKEGGVASCLLGQELPHGIGVRVGTMHRFKGLEFRCVAVIDCDDDTMPDRWALTPAAVDPVQRSVDMHRERCLLYVACTRARESLWVGWSGQRSRFLEFVAGDEI